jgi:deazaflavin-dependent oxidoreductase (nitroreductase family)
MNDRRWGPGDPVDWQRPGELWTSGGLHSFVVETTGAHSGQTRRAVLGYLEDGPDAWLIIGSKGGAPTNPAWVHNLVTNPDTVVEVGTDTIPVRARIATGEERERIWSRQKEQMPGFAEYAVKAAGREIPVVVLERR